MSKTIVFFEYQKAQTAMDENRCCFILAQDREDIAEYCQNSVPLDYDECCTEILERTCIRLPETRREDPQQIDKIRKTLKEKLIKEINKGIDKYFAI